MPAVETNRSSRIKTIGVPAFFTPKGKIDFQGLNSAEVQGRSAPDARPESRKRRRRGAHGGKVETLFEPLLRHKNAAKLLDVSAEKLRQMAVRGEVPAHKIGRYWKYRPSELDEWLQKK
jgi:excisionase family DNA binding protein